MKRPPKPVEMAFEEFLNERPPDDAELAREFNAFTRRRKIKTPVHLLQVAMLYCGLDQALRTTAGSFSLLQERITDMAIHRRLRACGPWLKALLHRMLPGLAAAGTRTGRLLVVDGSSLAGPGGRGTDDRLHLALDLTDLTLHAVQATGVEGAESLTRYPWQAGDAVLADRGYCHPRAILDLGERQVQVIVRFMPTAMPVSLRRPDEAFDPTAPRLDVAAHRREVTGDTASVSVWRRAQEASGPGWLHAVRLPPAAAEVARQRCRKDAKRKGRVLRPETLELAGWVMVLTTIPPAELDGPAILALYRCRWHVELAIKRLKSLLDLDALRTQRDSLLGSVWILGK
jgi:hypothetical protein